MNFLLPTRLKKPKVTLKSLDIRANLTEGKLKWKQSGKIKG